MRHITLLLCFAMAQLYAQENYALDTIDQQELQKYVAQYHQSNEALMRTIKNTYPKKIAKQLNENFKNFGAEFEASILAGDFIFDKRFLDMANAILDEFKLKNPNIPKNITVLISKDPSLNAYCLPDGTFVLNVGLFYWLENKDQIAGVMAHELSHKLLEHSVKGQVKQIRDAYSDKRKKQVKALKKTRFNRSKRAFNLYKSLLYTTSENRRKREIEADSLGFLMLRHTKYNTFELIKTFKLAKVYDTIRPKDLKKEIYPKVFDLPNQKFNPKWLKCEDFSTYDYDLYKEDFDKDSLASHPELMIRINKIKKTFKLQNVESNETQPSEDFLELQKLADYNFIPNLMHFENIGASIYLCLKQIQEGNDEQYYKKLLGENFKIILEGRKKYQLNRYLERVKPNKQSQSYIQFLNFMWNLSLPEIENITNYYTKK